MGIQCWNSLTNLFQLMIKIVCFSRITTLVLLMETKRNWSNRTVNDHTVRVFVSIGCRGSAWPIWISTSASPDDVKKPFVHVHSIWIYFLFAAHLYIVSAESCVVCEISRNISTERARARTSIAFWGRARKFIAKFIQSVLWRWFRLGVLFCVLRLLCFTLWWWRYSFLYLLLLLLLAWN